MVRICQHQPRQNKLKVRRMPVASRAEDMRGRRGKWKTFITLLFTLSSLLFTLSSCSNKRNKQYDPTKVNFSVQYNPLFDNQLYPSLLLAIGQGDVSTINPQLTTFTCSVTAPANNAVLRIVIDSSSFNYITTIQEILTTRDQTYTFQPSIKWKYPNLRAQLQPTSADLTFTCYINDEQTDIKNIHLGVRSVNECPLSLRLDNQIIDTRWLFAAYVNEDHPLIQQILTDIIDQGTVPRFDGYQSNNPSSVTDQVFAVWNYILNNGIAYSSISCTSNPSPKANVQHIRFLDQSLTSRQANCIDACVLFASILRKIGLKPLIFVEPCHAYLGYYTDKKRQNIALLETTVTSWVNFPEIRRNLLPDGRIPDKQIKKIARYLSDEQIQAYHDHRTTTDQLLLQVAQSLFTKASQYNTETYNQNRNHFSDPDNISYQQLDIENLRSLVSPIN